MTRPRAPRTSSAANRPRPRRRRPSRAPTGTPRVPHEGERLLRTKPSRPSCASWRTRARARRRMGPVRSRPLSGSTRRSEDGEPTRTIGGRGTPSTSSTSGHTGTHSTSAPSARAVLVITSGANTVNEFRVGMHVKEALGKAPAAFVRQVTGFAIGGIPPIAHATPIETFIDQDLLKYPEIWAAAGTPNALFRLVPADLVKMTGGRVIRVT